MKPSTGHSLDCATGNGEISLPNHKIPPLTFPTVRFSAKEIPWDLQILLYKGGALAPSRNVMEQISKGTLGKPILARLTLVKKIHEEINGKLVGGDSDHTAAVVIRCFRDLFGWAEGEGHPLTVEYIQSTYLSWSDSLLNRVRTIKDLENSSAYSRARCVGNIIDLVLERHSPLLHLTRLRRSSSNRGALGIQGEKENLQDTFEFGHFLQDICDGLSAATINSSQFPFEIARRDGQAPLVWSRFFGDADTRLADASSQTRSPLINLRIEAELFIFISQTGMNLTQTINLSMKKFFYASHIDGYQVRDRKERRGGDVLFEIFKEYKPHFERYIAWLDKMRPGSTMLFPFMSGESPSSRHKGLRRIKAACGRAGVPYSSPRALRNTRVNWLLRRSGDPEMTAELAQHTKETLLKVYRRPSQQVAMGELVRFWSKADPSSDSFRSVAPGACRGMPIPTLDAPSEAARPDCIHPSGCLWCKHHRDIDSLEHVWSLASFRYLKTIELSKWPAPKASKSVHPAQTTVDRLTAKLRWFNESNSRRQGWVDEAQIRIEEGNYHPDWHILIASAEGLL